MNTCSFQLTASAVMVSLCLTSGVYVQAAVTTFEVKNEDPNQILKDITIGSFDGGSKIRGVTDNGNFDDPPNNTDFSRARAAVTLDEGDLAGGATTTVIFDTIEPGTKLKVIKRSYLDGTEAMVALIGIGATVIPGGNVGREFAGVAIPPDHYGYFYEAWNAVTFDANPFEFRIQLGYIPPVEMGVLNDSWIPEVFNDDVREIAQNDFAVENDLVEDNLTGIPGTSGEWFFDGAAAVATFPNGIASPGEHGSVMYLVHEAGPQVGGPLGFLGDNASILGEIGEVLHGGSLIAPVAVFPGDLNTDGTLDNQDIQPFIDRLLLGEFDPIGDINQDGLFDNQDIQPFIDLLLGPGGVENPREMVPEPSSFCSILLAFTVVAGLRWNGRRRCLRRITSCIIGAVFASIAGTAAPCVCGAATLWFSATPNPSATSNPTVIVPAVGDSKPIYLFANLESGESLSGLGLSIDNQIAGIASGTIGDWQNPNFLGQDRWNTSSITNLPYAFTPGELIPHLNAVAVVGAWGLNGDVASLDPTLNVDTNSLLVGRIDVLGLSPGTTDVFLSIGPATISGSGFSSVMFGAADTTSVDPRIVGAASAIPDARIMVVPEPTTLSLFVCVALLLACGRRQRHHRRAV